MSDKKTIVAYKGFDKNLKCRDFQYEVGKSYKHKGKLELCESGFHACENPLDVLDYYDIVDSRFALVECAGKVKEDSNHTKIVTAELHIKCELTLPEFINHSLFWLSEVRIHHQYEVQEFSRKDGDRHSSRMNNSQQASIGDRTKHASSGCFAKHASSGYHTKHASSGSCTQHASSGSETRHASSGDQSRHASSGGRTRHSSSGCDTKHASSGHQSRHASSGSCTRHASSGNRSRHASSGDCTRHECNGANAVVACSGPDSSAKGVNGTWISLAEYDQYGECIGFATGCIGKNGLKENVYYKAEKGELVEVKP